MSGSHCKILGIGSPIIDISCSVDDKFLMEVVGEKSSAERCSFKELELLQNNLNSHKFSMQRFSGGSAGNTMKVLGKLIKFFGSCEKLSASFCGISGMDNDGSFFRREMEKSGVDLKYFSNLSDLKTDCCMAFVTPDGERTFRTSVEASTMMNGEWAKKIDFKEFDLVLVEAYTLYNAGLFQQLIELISNAGAEIALDLSSIEVVKKFRTDLEKVFNTGKVSMIFANESEADAFIGSKNPSENCRKLAELCKIAAVKVGADGVWIGNKGEIFHTKGDSVKVIDTTGAGDSWAGAFLYGYAIGKTLDECAKLANKTASLMVQNQGTNIIFEAGCFN